MFGIKIYRAILRYFAIRIAKKAWIKQIEKMNKTKIYDRRGTSSEAELRKRIEEDIGVHDNRKL